MDNFDLKEYLANNPLFEKETLNGINVLDIIKKKIKKEYGVDATDDQIFFGDGSPVEEQSLFELDKLLESGKSHIINEGMIGGVTEGLCNVGVWVIVSILKFFPVILSKLGDRWAKEFIQDIFEGNSPAIIEKFAEVEEYYPDRFDSTPIKAFKIVLFPSKKAVEVFTVLSAAAIRLFQVASNTICQLLIGGGNLADWIIDIAKNIDDIPEQDDEWRDPDLGAFKRVFRRRVKKHNQTGKNIDI
jgi:hypothetical protein